MEPRRLAKVLDKVSEVGINRVKSSLGDVGQKLCSLLLSVGDHPEVDELFFDDSDSDLCVLMDMLRFEDDFSVPRMAGFAEIVASDKFRLSRVPGGGGFLARVLRPPLRDTVRLARRPQRLGSSLADFFKLRWESCPSSFANFRSGCETETPEPMKKALGFFSENACQELARSALEISGLFYSPPSVFGYRRLSLRDASCILAKGMGFRLCQEGCLVDSPEGCFQYSPVAIPLPLAGKPPTRVSDSVSSAELPHPVFDHYLVLVPFVGKKVSGRPVSDPNFPMVDDALSALQNGDVPCVVLGERDGKCYFVSEWTQLKP